MRLTEELDYGLEARNQAGFADDYREHPFIRVPEVRPAPVHVAGADERVGRSASAGRRCSRPQAERDRAGEMIFRFVFRSLYRSAPSTGTRIRATTCSTTAAR